MVSGDWFPVSSFWFLVSGFHHSSSSDLESVLKQPEPETRNQ